MQAAEEARKKKQAEQMKHADLDTESFWGSMPGQLTNALAAKQAKKTGKKAMFAEADGDGDVQVSVKQGAGSKVMNALCSFGILRACPVACGLYAAAHWVLGWKTCHVQLFHCVGLAASVDSSDTTKSNRPGPT